MKKVLKFVSICMILSMLFSISAYADELRWEDFYGEDTDCVLTPEGTVISRDEKHSKARDKFLSTAIAQITNEGKGNIGILLHTMAHVNVDKIRQEAFLDQWDPKREEWVCVESFNFIATKDQYPDGLYQFVTSATVSDQPEGYYYRVRGLHAVWLNGEFEGFGTATNGVLLTNP